MTALFYSAESLPMIKNKECLLHLLPSIHPKKLANLSEEQIKLLDFSAAGPIDQDIFDGIIGKDTFAYYSIVMQKMGCLQTNQLVEGLKRNLFDSEARIRILDSQLKHLTLEDLKGYDYLINRKKALK